MKSFKFAINFAIVVAAPSCGRVTVFEIGDMRTPVLVSDLILDPGSYDGRRIEVVGYLMSFSDGLAISLFRQDAWNTPSIASEEFNIQRAAIYLSYPPGGDVDDYILSHASSTDEGIKMLHQALLRFTGTYFKPHGLVLDDDYRRERFEVSKISINK
jgi:hypothetical protein